MDAQGEPRLKLQKLDAVLDTGVGQNLLEWVNRGGLPQVCGRTRQRRALSPAHS